MVMAFNKKHKSNQEGEIVRVRMPRDKEVLGVVIEMLGASRFRIDCMDDKERICRIPGKLKRRMWVRTGDIVIILPWDIEPDAKADIIWRYTPAQSNYLRNNGHLDKD